MTCLNAQHWSSVWIWLEFGGKSRHPNPQGPVKLGIVFLGMSWGEHCRTDGGTVGCCQCLRLLELSSLPFLAYGFLFFLKMYLFVLIGRWLQYCDGFCHTSTWIGHRYTWLPSPFEAPRHLPPHPIHPGCGRALALDSLQPTSNYYWISILHMIVSMFQRYPLKSSHSLLLPLSPKVYSLCLCLFLLCSLNHDCKMTTLPPDKCPVQEEEREREMVIPYQESKNSPRNLCRASLHVS